MCTCVYVYLVCVHVNCTTLIHVIFIYAYITYTLYISYVQKLFAPGTKYSGLESIDRRYAWFKRLLKVSDDKISTIIPSHWCLIYYLFLEFSRRTKKHIKIILSNLEQTMAIDLNSHVQILLKALKSIIQFENEMKSMFNLYTTHTLDNNTTDTTPTTDTTDTNNSSSNSEVNIEYSESLSEAFDSYLGPYVQLEREELERLMDKINNEERGYTNNTGGNTGTSTGTGSSHGNSGGGGGGGGNNTSANNDDGEGPLKPGEPFISSRKMFEFIKKSLKRCTLYSTGQTYLALSKEYRICLHNYAESLKFRCPSPEFSKPGQPLRYTENMYI